MLKITMLVIKYGYIFRLILSHPQANMVTEFRYIKCAPNWIPLCLLEVWPIENNPELNEHFNTYRNNSTCSCLGGLSSTLEISDGFPGVLAASLGGCRDGTLKSGWNPIMFTKYFVKLK